jgi:hypothetical protein
MSYNIGPHDYDCNCFRCESRRPPKAVLSEDGIVMSRMIDIIKLLTDIRLQDKELWTKIVEFQHLRRNI